MGLIAIVQIFLRLYQKFSAGKHGVISGNNPFDIHEERLELPNQLQDSGKRTIGQRVPQDAVTAEYCT